MCGAHEVLETSNGVTSGVTIVGIPSVEVCLDPRVRIFVGQRVIARAAFKAIVARAAFDAVVAPVAGEGVAVCGAHEVLETSNGVTSGVTIVGIPSVEVCLDPRVRIFVGQRVIARAAFKAIVARAALRCGCLPPSPVRVSPCAEPTRCSKPVMESPVA